MHTAAYFSPIPPSHVHEGPCVPRQTPWADPKVKQTADHQFPIFFLAHPCRQQQTISTCSAPTTAETFSRASATRATPAPVQPARALPPPSMLPESESCSRLEQPPGGPGSPLPQDDEWDLLGPLISDQATLEADAQHSTSVSLSIQHRPPDPSTHQQAAAQMHTVITALQSGSISTASDDYWSLMDNETWLSTITTLLLDPAHFTAGFIGQRIELFRLYFKKFGLLTAEKQVLSWLETGVPVSWVSVHASSQQTHPRFKIRLAQVTSLLESTVGPAKAASFLQGTR